MQSTRRLALMNMFLYNIGDITGESIISSAEVQGRRQKASLLASGRDFWALTDGGSFHAPRSQCNDIERLFLKRGLIPLRVLLPPAFCLLQETA